MAIVSAEKLIEAIENLSSSVKTALQSEMPKYLDTLAEMMLETYENNGGNI